MFFPDCKVRRIICVRVPDIGRRAGRPVFGCVAIVYKQDASQPSISLHGRAPLPRSYGFMLWKNATMRAVLADGKL